MNTPDRNPVTATWRKSSYSTATGDCVEVAPAAEGVQLRHSKRPEDGTIIFSQAAWTTFLQETRADLPSANGVATVTKDGTDTHLTARQSAVTLRFDADEWSAFRAGALDGEFDLTGEATPAAS